MADRSRLQVRTSLDPEVWSDVGEGSVGVSLPIEITNTLVTTPFDYIGATYPNTSTEVYTYKTGGSGGTTVATITVVYSDAVTKAIITSVTKT